jgi:hypothetical protein
MTEEESSNEVKEETSTQRSLQQPDSIVVSRPRIEIRKPGWFTDTMVYAQPITDVLVKIMERNHDMLILFVLYTSITKSK